jgi:multiple sugar transport system permease protein
MRLAAATRSQAKNGHVPVMRRLSSYAVLVSASIILMIPIVWWLLTSLKKESEYLTYPLVIIPAQLQWQNYINAVTRFDFMQYLSNSLFLATTSSVLTVITSAMCGYAFARMGGVIGHKRLFSIVVAILVLPGIVTTIPNFLVYARLGLTNSYWPWVLGALGASPYHIFLFRQFFTSIPKELEEAAEVDGCGPLRMFWQIFLPNAWPAVATSFIFNFQWVWGDVISPVLYLRDDQTTLAVKLANAFVDPVGNPIITLSMAAAVVYTLPLIIMFFLAQRQILQGVVTSGIKG